MTRRRLYHTGAIASSVEKILFLLTDFFFFFFETKISKQKIFPRCWIVNKGELSLKRFRVIAASLTVMVETWHRDFRRSSRSSASVRLDASDFFLDFTSLFHLRANDTTVSPSDG